MVTVHPSAIVDRQVELGEGVEVGPGCVIQGRVVIGAGCRLIGHVYVQGPVVMGEGNVLYPFVCVGFEPQDVKYKGSGAGVRVGSQNIFRESATVHGATGGEGATAIGDSNYFMTNSHVGHDAVVGSRCTLVSGALIGGHAVLEDGVTIGGNGAVHQFCRVGRLSLIGGCSAITKDLPPFMLERGINGVIGPNVVGLRRAGQSGGAIDGVRRAYRVLYLESHSNAAAAERIERMAEDPGNEAAGLLGHLVGFIRGSRRGLVPRAGRARGVEEL